MPAGRPPKPNKLKELAGNPGKRAVNAEEPEFTMRDLDCPEFLTLAAKGEWCRIAGQLRDLDMLRSVDQAALAGYCQSYARWVSAEKTVDNEGQTIQVPILNKQGEVVGYNTKRHPATLISKDEKIAMQKFAGLFGFDPSSRSKIHVPKTKVKSPLDAILDGDEEQLTVN